MPHEIHNIHGIFFRIWNQLPNDEDDEMDADEGISGMHL